MRAQDGLQTQRWPLQPTFQAQTRKLWYSSDFNPKQEKAESEKQSPSQRWQANTNRVKGLLQTANAYCGPIKHLIALSGRECCHILSGHKGEIDSFRDLFEYSNPLVFEQYKELTSIGCLLCTKVQNQHI